MEVVTQRGVWWWVYVRELFGDVSRKCMCGEEAVRESFLRGVSIGG